MRLLVDATTLLAWDGRPPVGTVRLERLIVGELCRRLPEAALGFVKVREGALVPVTPAQRETIMALAGGTAEPAAGAARANLALARPPGLGRRLRRWLKARRRPGALAEAEAAAFAGATAFATLGHGWDHLDHARLAALRRRHGFRVRAFVHDLIAVDYPHFFHDPAHADRLRRHHAALCEMADLLVVNSEATRAALVRFAAACGLPLPRLHLAPLPTALPAPAVEVPLPAGCGEEPFVLYVSTVEIRKNHRLLLRLWSRCAREGQHLPRLVLVGRMGWGVEEVRLLLRHDPALAGRVLLLENLPDAQLTALYRACLFTVYPSFAEGWGMPISEALAAGRICVHARDPAQAEAAQGLMPALDPDDLGAWRAEIVALAEDPARRAALELRLRRELRPRDGGTFAAEVAAALTGTQPAQASAAAR